MIPERREQRYRELASQYSVQAGSRGLAVGAHDLEDVEWLARNAFPLIDQQMHVVLGPQTDVAWDSILTRLAGSSADQRIWQGPLMSLLWNGPPALNAAIHSGFDLVLVAAMPHDPPVEDISLTLWPTLREEGVMIWSRYRTQAKRRREPEVCANVRWFLRQLVPGTWETVWEDDQTCVRKHKTV
jgi:hypothetical protein